MANQALTVSPQPAVAVEGPVSKMSPPTNDVTNGVVAPQSTEVPRVPPTTNPSLVQTNRTPVKYTPKDFIFGKVIGEGSFGTVSSTKIELFLYRFDDVTFLKRFLMFVFT